MKFIKKTFKVLAVLLILIILVSFFLPSTFHGERSIVIKSNPDIIFAQLNNFKNWNNWSPWDKYDPNMKKEFAEKTEGLGASYSWSGNNQVGTGNMTISTSIPNDSIQTTMNFEGMGKAYGSFKLSKAEDGTKVVWAMDSTGEGVPWYMYVPHKYFSLFMDKMVGPDFEQGLNNLKTISEKMAKEAPVVAKSEYKIEETKTTTQTVAS